MKYVKKSNKVCKSSLLNTSRCVKEDFSFFLNFSFQLSDIALAKAGIAARVGVVGIFVFISLLVTAYVPYTR